MKRIYILTLLGLCCCGSGSSEASLNETAPARDDARMESDEPERASSTAPTHSPSNQETAGASGNAMPMRAGSSSNDANDAMPANAANEPGAREPEAGSEPSGAMPEQTDNPVPMNGTESPTQQATADADWPADCEERHVFRVHGVSTPGDTSKYRVPAGEQWVATFYYKSPWSGDIQLLQTRARIDNPKILHHWTLLVTQNNQALDGTIRAQIDTRPELIGGELPLISGAPGATDLKLPTDIGLRMTGGANLLFELEIHYFNAGTRDEEDGSGIEVCVTHKKRPIAAAIHTLGRNSFMLPAHQRTDITTTCSPEAQVEPIHLMNVTPHMHLTGVHAKMVLNRKSGEVVTLHDDAYDFLEQRSHPLPQDGSAAAVVVEPGDSITSTCTYDNTHDEAIPQGQRSQDEMCEMAVLAWPAGALHNQYSALVGLFPGKEQFRDVMCMDP